GHVKKKLEIIGRSHRVLTSQIPVYQYHFLDERQDMNDSDGSHSPRKKRRETITSELDDPNQRRLCRAARDLIGRRSFRA
ncbi:MAG: hypothetical protein P8130_14185, partial [Deltaproteobacteria bacterium]